MKIIVRLLVLLAVVAAPRAQSQPVGPPLAPAARLVVRLQDNLRAELQQAKTSTAPRPAAELFAHVNREYRAERVQPLNPGQPLADDAPAVYLIVLPPGTDAPQARRAYEQTGLFRYVELDGVGQGGGVQGTVPNDNWYGRQWYLKNNGTFSPTAHAGADIKMEDAWAASQGDSTMTVAIIDSGCKLDHPEFANRIWRNRREIANNGLDDDFNGYVDDVNGWNFVSNTTNPVDDLGHGTNVAGIIGATGNNGMGYAGINWKCKLMICKAIDAQNFGYYSWWTAGIYYAVGNGARVINMSLGGSTTSQAMQDAVAYATQRGVVVVASMMNNNNNVTYYPAGLAEVLSVGATSPDDTRTNPFFWSATSGSSYGAHISVVAPGNFIYGLDYRSNTNYGSYWGGTSQAAPQVAGLASLLLTLRPQLTPAQGKATIQNTADDRVGNPAEDVAGWDPYYGFGRINAARALATVVTGSRTGQAARAGFQVFPNPARGRFVLQLNDARLVHQQVQVFNSLGQLVGQQQLNALTQQLPLQLAAGTYWVAVSGAGGGQRLVVE